jgi:acyl-CoA thioester hydrolase
MTHSIQYRVYYEDTDAGGIKYHGNFINFCERARTEFIISRGVSNQRLLKENIGVVVRHLECNYYAPAYLEDIVEVRTQVLSVKNSSFVLQHTILRDNVALFDMNVVLVCITPDGKPVRVPQMLLNILDKE